MEWTYGIPKEKGWYWFKEEYKESGSVDWIGIILFDGVHFNPENEYDECGPGDALFEELYGNCKWYGPIEPPK